MALDSEFAAKICSWTASPEAAALDADAELEAADAEALVALVLPEAALEAELLPDPQPTSANAATRAIASTAAAMR